MSTFKSIKFFQRASFILFLVLIALLLVHKFYTPISLWLALASFACVPFASVVIWYGSETKDRGIIYVPITIALIGFLLFIFFGWEFTGERYNIFGQLIITVGQLFISAWVVNKLENFSRNLARKWPNQK